MTALSRGIPITLLCDLAESAGPASRSIYCAEQADDGWLHEFAFSTEPDSRVGEQFVSA
jgi:hypothetical protein